VAKRQKSKNDHALEALLVEAHRINYRLRSTFFLQKLREYNTLGLPPRIAGLAKVEGAYSWDERASWNVDEDAFEIIQGGEVTPIHVFCHPKLIREHSSLIAYYRHVAVLSQKSVKYLIGLDVKKWECRPEADLAAGDALSLARLFNEHVSLVVNSSVTSLDPEHVTALLLASTGSQIDGSWRNAIGVEAEKLVQRLLVKEAIERKLLVAMIRRSDGTEQQLYDVNQLGAEFDISKYKGFLLTNKTSVLFSSEPDISLLKPNGESAGVVEVKGGTDPAGALDVTVPPRSHLKRLSPRIHMCRQFLLPVASPPKSTSASRMTRLLRTIST
jgi:hypothetical protein